MHRFLFLFAVGVWPFISEAQKQHYPHLTLWSRVQVAKEPNPNWNLVGTLMWRRQNNYQENPHNPTASPLTVGGQALITHRNTQNTVWVHIAQMSYMVSNQLLGKEEDFNAPIGKEFRYAGGVEFNQEVNEKLTFRQRFMQELRFFKANNFHPVGRVRGRANIRYQFTPFVSVNGVTEILFHDPPLLSGQKPLRFHQFWLGGSLLWSLSERVNLETGYTFIHGRRATLVEFDEQNVLNLHLAFEI
ncbi:DUF2490 domain-containing protein [Runella salmonicolor]|uniref:DUF2490 domain-containing protein n=1 Tax=Runella salmonicolor TaxID=2950278 RepID=A0ABT1FMX6_9BACT|nr:DUF2490 domain-containing protein [Runella salmonicolor]MCP1383119.1 DUF2490 domain-containing protein [Runella salmonicolor]